MTEEEWLNSTKPTPMLELLKGEASDRKLRLFAVACCRRVEQWMNDERSRQAIEVSEQYADRKVGRKVLSAARRAAFSASKEAEASQTTGQSYTVEHSSAIVALNVSANPEEGSVMLGLATAGCANTIAFHIQGDEVGWLDLAHQAILLREVFGNPFRPVAIAPGWLTSDVVALATGIYDEKAFDRMPILADALMDAECDNEDVLNHCRSEGPHCRGCWLIDLLTGRK